MKANAADAIPEINSPGKSSVAAVFPEAKLRVLETLFRAGTGNTTVFTVMNDGQETAQIRGLRFRPEAEFQNSDTPEISSAVVQGAVTSINFAPTDNTSPRAASGYHGSYRRELETVLTIPAGESRSFRVTIVDPEHSDWGFVGRLELDYNASKPLVIEAARVTFAAKS